MRAAGGAAMAGAIPTGLTGQAAREPSTAAFQQSVARWCFSDIPLETFCRELVDLQLPAIDLLTPEEWPVALDHGLVISTADVAAGTIEDGLNDPANHDTIVEAFREWLPRAREAGIPNAICFFGNRRGMEDAEGIRNSIACLERCKGIAEDEGVTIVVEMLNNAPGGHIDYMGDNTPYAVEIVGAVDSPRVKLLYDVFHMQIMEGDVIRTIQNNAEYFAHYHTGGVPGRAEIDETQELYYPAIMRAIRDTGFTGYVAHEFIPQGPDPIAALRDGMRRCTV